MGGLKGLAVLLFGRLLVPTVAFEEAFFRDYAHEVLAVVGDSVPVCLLGGLVSHSAIEGALASGFALVQMARALIHDPGLVERIRGTLAACSADHAADIEDHVSGCTHCNACVVSTLSPGLPSGCVLRSGK